MVSNDTHFVRRVLANTVNGTTYVGTRARTTGAPQNHWCARVHADARRRRRGASLEIPDRLTGPSASDAARPPPRFGPAGDPRGAGIGSPEAIQVTWSCHREIITDEGPVPGGWVAPPPS